MPVLLVMALTGSAAFEFFRQALVSELDLAEQLAGVRQRVRDHHARVVSVEQALVKLRDFQQRREPELSRLQDQVARPEVSDEVDLLLVGLEADGLAVLVNDPVQVRDAPLRSRHCGPRMSSSVGGRLRDDRAISAAPSVRRPWRELQPAGAWSADFLLTKAAMALGQPQPLCSLSFL